MMKPDLLKRETCNGVLSLFIFNRLPIFFSLQLEGKSHTSILVNVENMITIGDQAQASSIYLMHPDVNLMANSYTCIILISLNLKRYNSIILSLIIVIHISTSI